MVDNEGGKWVTMRGRHVFMPNGFKGNVNDLVTNSPATGATGPKVGKLNTPEQVAAAKAKQGTMSGEDWGSKFDGIHGKTPRDAGMQMLLRHKGDISVHAGKAGEKTHKISPDILSRGVVNGDFSITEVVPMSKESGYPKTSGGVIMIDVKGTVFWKGAKFRARADWTGKK